MKGNARLLLFENKVYSTEPNVPEDQFWGPDPMYYRILGAYTDEQLMYVLNPQKAQKDILSAGNKLYLFDYVITDVWWETRQYQKRQRNRIYDLECARKVIVDDRYPVFISYIRKFKRWTKKREMQLSLGKYILEFGRCNLIEMIESVRYESAIPELREVILYDREHRMVSAAIDALAHMGTEKAARCINGLFFEKNLSHLKLYALLCATEKLSYGFIVKGLHHAFLENYHYYPKDFAEIYCKLTIQEKILKSCSKIPTLQALHVLEMGIAHPYSHVEETAYNQIKDWTKFMLNRIEEGKDDGYGLVLAEVIKRYDFEIFNESYRKLKKGFKLMPEKN